MKVKYYFTRHKNKNVNLLYQCSCMDHNQNIGNIQNSSSVYDLNYDFNVPEQFSSVTTPHIIDKIIMNFQKHCFSARFPISGIFQSLIDISSVNVGLYLGTT